ERAVLDGGYRSTVRSRRGLRGRRLANQSSACATCAPCPRWHPALWRFARSFFLHWRPKSSVLAEPVVGECCAAAPAPPTLFVLLRSISVRLVVVLALILPSFP